MSGLSEKQTIEIRHILEQVDLSLNKKPVNVSGFFSGTSGVSLFHFYYHAFTGESESYENGMKCLEFENKNLSNQLHISPKLNNISWLIWVIFTLEKDGIIEIEKKQYKEFIPILISNFDNFSKQKNYDLLYGNISLGLALNYFLNNKDLINKFKYFFESIMETDERGIKWSMKDIKSDSTTSEYNFSLAHGIPSITLFLNILCSNATTKEKALLNLISGGVNYMLSHIQSYEDFGSYFPNTIKDLDNNHFSRLAWCYGDLGVGYAILKSGELLGNDSYVSIAMEILLKCAKRRTYSETLIKDIGICHGSSGLILFFKKLHELTHRNEFKEAYLFWMDYTINEIKSKGEIENVLVHRADEHGGPIFEEGLLTGIAGVGLTLLSVLSDQETSWQEFLLL